LAQDHLQAQAKYSRVRRRPRRRHSKTHPMALQVAQNLPFCWCQRPEYPYGHLIVGQSNPLGRVNCTAPWGRNAGIIALQHTFKHDFSGGTELVTEVLLVSQQSQQLNFPTRKRDNAKGELAYEVASRAWYEETGLLPDHLNFLMPTQVFVDAASGCHYFLARWEGGPGCPKRWSLRPMHAREGKSITMLQWTPIREAQSSAELGKLQRMILTAAEEEYHKILPLVPSVSMPSYPPMFWESPVQNFNQILSKPSSKAEALVLDDGRKTWRTSRPFEKPCQTDWEVAVLLRRAPAVLLGSEHEREAVLRLLQQGSTVEKSDIVRWICTDILSLAEDKHACRVVQRLFDFATTDDASFLVAHIFPHTQRLLESQHGNHVLTKAVEVAALGEVKQVIDCVREMDMVYVAQHRFGCRLFERLIENHAEDEVTARFFDEFSQRAGEMHKHKYGNYALQSMVEHGPTNSKRKVFTELVPEVPGMAVDRFASHLAQKMIQCGDPEDKLQTVKALIQAEEPALARIAADRFGNFVVKDMLQCLSTEDEIPEKERAALAELVRAKLDEAAEESSELAESETFQTVRQALEECRKALFL